MLIKPAAARCNRFLRTYKDAQMAAYTFLRSHTDLSLRTESQSLMSAVSTGDHTSSAANALFAVEFRIYDRVPFQIVRGQVK